MKWDLHNCSDFCLYFLEKSSLHKMFSFLPCSSLWIVDPPQTVYKTVYPAPSNLRVFNSSIVSEISDQDNKDIVFEKL